LADLLDVRDLLHVPVRKLSLGERMKMELAAALLHRPDVLFLDEPTIGLDVVAKARVRDFLAEVNRQRGTTILITSHDMDDIEALCNRVMIIDHGRIGYDGGLAQLVQSVRPRKRVRVTWAEAVEVAALPDDVTVLPSDDALVLSLEVSRERLGEVLAMLPAQGPLVDLDVSDADVEEIIREVFTSGIGQEARA
jgi:ABC-2 type transport system ATP-binding protein